MVAFYERHLIRHFASQNATFPYGEGYGNAGEFVAAQKALPVGEGGTAKP